MEAKGRVEKGDTLLLRAMPYSGFHERNRPPDGGAYRGRGGEGQERRRHGDWAPAGVGRGEEDLVFARKREAEGFQRVVLQFRSC